MAADDVALVHDLPLRGRVEHLGPPRNANTQRRPLDPVSGQLLPYVEAASVAAGSIGCTYRAYRSDALFEPGDVISGMKLKQINITATTVDATIGFDEVGQQAFPRAVYSIEDYPALFIGS